MMVDQAVFNWLLGTLSAALGAALALLWQLVRDLQVADRELLKVMKETEVLVAGEYVRKLDFDKTVNAIFAKLDRIEDKLDRKVDK